MSDDTGGDILLAELVEINTVADKHFAEFTKLNEAAKSAKRRWEGAVEQLQAAIRGSQEKFPLFDGVAEDVSVNLADDDTIDVEFTEKQLEGPHVRFEDAEDVESPGPTGESVSQKMEKPDESWKIVDIAQLSRHGLSAGVIEKIKDAGLVTIGAMANWSSSGKCLTDLPGIGEAKTTEIEDALDSFWSEWQHKQAVRPEESVEESEPKKRGRKKSA
jgi:hypothetical protein